MTRKYRRTKAVFVKKSYNFKQKTSNKVPCHCNKCKGNMVDPRTKNSHSLKRDIRPRGVIEEIIDLNQVSSDDLNQDTSVDLLNDPMEIESHNSDDGHHEPIVDEENYSFLPKKSKSSKAKSKDKRKHIGNDDTSDADDEENDQVDNDFDPIEEIPNESSSGWFDAPENTYGDDPEASFIDFTEDFHWIVLWILLYQERYKLSDVTTDSLVKFFRYLLVLLDANTYNSFPTSLYMARKKLGVCAHIVKFASCEKCCKLYNVTEVSTNDPYQVPATIHCTYVDFPDHPMANQRKKCNATLAKKVPVTNGTIYRPSLTFPTVSLKHQLQLMYNRKGFEKLCRKWADRNDSQFLNDIYDGKIWKTFQDHRQNIPFFRKDVSDRHLGIMLNIDWFQPFDNSTYSIGALYGVICNLPRNERFKPSNILTMALIPGPNEPSLHQLNHYIAPIIDQLIELWNGIELSKTYESSTGKSIRAAVICCSCDIPAARKLCGHISARVACHRCLKKAQYDDRNQPNFGGFDDIDEWFVERDINQVRRDAREWLNCNTKDARNSHVHNTLVRWSEMYRLPYFDSVRFLTVDPMHCLFLGIAKWIVTRLWIEEGRLTQKDLETMQKRANAIKVPADIGRIPYKIATGEGFSRFTADQWKTFILIYATSITWDLLQESDKLILANFVRACNILVCRSITTNGLEEAHKNLLEVAKLIEENYGAEKITPNLHLCLHICHCALDYGPLYAFWCFSYERMNGLLGSYHSSNRRIEPELLKTIQFNSLLDQFSSCAQDHQHLSTCITLITPKETTGSLVIHDEINGIDYREFLSMSRNVEEMAGTGSEPFPGTFLNPKRIDTNLSKEVLDLLVEYYRNAYGKDFAALSDIHAAPSAIPVLPKVNTYGRLKIGSEVFGSMYSKRHVTSAKILSQFLHDNTKDTYPGIVQFYFEHIIHFPEGSVNHSLAFVKWYLPAENHKTRFHCTINGDENLCNIELWKKEFYDLSRDCIIPVHSILGRFVEGSFSIGRKETRKYVSVIPINRKFHI
ncbi:uncharacterized protein LOC110040724 [Rhizophagus irregularis DAOM 181602=DAOM 197198]|nr:uncharacterized protein LOC110040724 [Rhizophagus irregularis DAOM 181602=DAOM 197198]GBC49380.2 uncharacterized protein LOC110040724 [Rhizophagus irregularis DAOM 181602=DAOM 197198]GET64360.1 uncharacterized protein LOC110040724 [Rhizophagus irregularis DAOM 181602=DAOM 197198]